MDMPSGFLGNQLTAVRTLLFLCLPETKQSLSPFEAIFHHQAEPLFEIRLPGGVERIRLTPNLDVALDRRVACKQQLHQLLLAEVSCYLRAEHPVAPFLDVEVALLDPGLGFLRVSPAGPLP